MGNSASIPYQQPNGRGRFRAFVRALSDPKPAALALAADILGECPHYMLRHLGPLRGGGTPFHIAAARRDGARLLTLFEQQLREWLLRAHTPESASLLAKLSTPSPARPVRRGAATGHATPYGSVGGGTCAWLEALEAVLDSRDSQGRTPLMVAVDGGHVLASKALLDMGADPCAVDSRGSRCALHIAARAGQTECVALLLQAGQQATPPGKMYVDSATSSGLTALHYAAFHGCVHVMELLLQAGADMTLASTHLQYDALPAEAGVTPLHIAAWRSNLPLVRSLLACHLARTLSRDPRRSSTDPRAAKTRAGLRPLDMARTSSRPSPEVLRLLTVSEDLAALMPAVLVAAAGGTLPQGAGACGSAAVPSLQLLAAAALSSRLARSVAQAAATAGTAAAATAACCATSGGGAAAAPDAPLRGRRALSRVSTTAAEGAAAGCKVGGQAGCQLTHEWLEQELRQSASAAASKQADPAGCGLAQAVRPLPFMRHSEPQSLQESRRCSGESVGSGGGGRRPTCGVCLDAACGVRSSLCGHSLCFGCANELAAQVLRKVEPLACPFCRRSVPAFVPLLAA